MMDRNGIFERMPELECCRGAMEKALDILTGTAKKGGKILLCGNGGSAADCEHIAGELLKGFLLRRPVTEAELEKAEAMFPGDAQRWQKGIQRGIAAVSLPSQCAIVSAYCNDVEPDLIYAQLVHAYARPEDAVLGLSTSGNSKNVVQAMRMARLLGVPAIALTGSRPCKLDEVCDAVIKVPETETYRVQEYHLPVYHWLCAMLEERLFGAEG